MSRNAAAEQALNGRVLQALQAAPDEVNFGELMETLDLAGQREMGLLAGALHRLEDRGLAEVLRKPGQLAAYWRATVTTAEVVPVDLDHLIAEGLPQ